MKEQPPQTPEQLQQRLVKTNSVLEKLSGMFNAPATITSANLRLMRSQLQELSGDEKVDKAIEIGLKRKQIVAAIGEKTLPRLFALRETLGREIGQVEKSAQLAQLIAGRYLDVEVPSKVGRARREILPVSELRMQVMNLFLENPQIPIEQIIEFLGPSPKTGKRLNAPQANFVLLTVAILAYLRKGAGSATTDELDLFERIKQFTGRENDRDAYRAFKSKLKRWYRSQRKAKESELRRKRSKTAKKETIRKANTVKPDRLAALEWLVANPIGSYLEVTTILAPTKNGRRLSPAQALRALQAASGLLFRRHAHGLLVPAEAATFRKLKRFCQNNGLATPEEFSRHLHWRFFPTRK